LAKAPATEVLLAFAPWLDTVISRNNSNCHIALGALGFKD